MYFRAQLTGDTQFDLSNKEPLTFQLTTLRDVTVVVRQDDSRGNVLITHEESVTSEIDDLLLQWEMKEWPEEKNVAKSLTAIFDQHRQWAYDTANQVLQAVRWRSGDIAQNHELSQPALAYSRDGETWVSFPPPTPVGIPRPRIVRTWNVDTIAHEVASATKAGIKWPVACELLQEARNLSEYAPRSAIVLGVSAFEVGVKAFVGARVPKARWLIDKLPSPDALKILREYAPSLTDRNPCPPKRVRRILTLAVELRNQISHGGKEGPSYQELQSMLDAIEDTIWLFEWSSGFDRAWSFIWGETQVDYLCEWLQQMAPKIPDLSDKEQQQLCRAIPSLLRVDDSTPNAIKRLTELRVKLPKHFMDSLTPHLAFKAEAELWPESPPGAPKMIKYRQHFPRVPRIG